MQIQPTNKLHNTDVETDHTIMNQNCGVHTSYFCPLGSWTSYPCTRADLRGPGQTSRVALFIRTGQGFYQLDSTGILQWKQ